MIKRLTRLSPIIGLCIFGALGCQEVNQPTTVLTRQQWEQVQKHLLKTEPAPKYKLNINYGDKIELIGLDVQEPLEAGKEATFTWYWRAKEDIKQDWRIFIHFDSVADKNYRQNLDHHAIGELFPSSKWKKGMIIEDIQKVKLHKDWPKGEAIPYIGLYRGKERLPVQDATKHDGGNRAIGPKLAIGGVERPRYAARSFNGAQIKVDGVMDEEQWQKLPVMALTSLGQAPNQETWVKAFYTEDALYLGAYLSDEHIWGTLKERDAQTWTQEVLEVFIDPNGDGKDYLELQITPQNVIFDARFEAMLGMGKGTRQEQIDRARAFSLEGLETAVKVDGTLNDDKDKDKAWTVEIKLPFASLPGAGAPPQPGANWAMNLYRFDRPTPQSTYAYAWSTQASRSFHEVSKYGTLQFISGAPMAPRGLPQPMLKLDPKNLRPLAPVRQPDPRLVGQDKAPKLTP